MKIKENILRANICPKANKDHMQFTIQWNHLYHKMFDVDQQTLLCTYLNGKKNKSLQQHVLQISVIGLEQVISKETKWTKKKSYFRQTVCEMQMQNGKVKKSTKRKDLLTRNNFRIPI